METILEKIYHNSYEPELLPTKNYQKARDSRSAVWDEAEKTLGTERIIQLWDAQMEIVAQENFIDFRAGFRLGAALMLELMDR